MARIIAAPEGYDAIHSAYVSQLSGTSARRVTSTRTKLTPSDVALNHFVNARLILSRFVISGRRSRPASEAYDVRLDAACVAVETAPFLCGNGGFA